MNLMNSSVSSMIGDTNLYIIEKDLKEKTAEAAVMIADPNYRSKGFGWEAMLLMLNYGNVYPLEQSFV
ncbi:N-acetyltransferase 9 [Capsicum chinense]|nr:N-acetyltransferase 9 [Capsicum chinense]